MSDQTDQAGVVTYFRLILTVGFLFLFSAYFAYGELEFLLVGKTAEARVTWTSYQTFGGNPNHNEFTVEYDFTEADGTRRIESDNVSRDWTFATTGSNITIQYLPGVKGSSRLLGHSERTMVYLFFGFLTALVVAVVLLWRHANQAMQRPAPWRRQR